MCIARSGSVNSPRARRSQSSVRSNEESKPPLSPTIILVGFNRREASAKEASTEVDREAGNVVAGAEAARRRGSKQKARLSAASSVASAFTSATSLEAALEGALGAEAIAHKPFVAPLNKRLCVGRAEPIHLF